MSEDSFACAAVVQYDVVLQLSTQSSSVCSTYNNNSNSGSRSKNNSGNSSSSTILVFLRFTEYTHSYTINPPHDVMMLSKLITTAYTYQAISIY